MRANEIEERPAAARSNLGKGPASLCFWAKVIVEAARYEGTPVGRSQEPGGTATFNGANHARKSMQGSLRGSKVKWDSYTGMGAGSVLDAPPKSSLTSTC